MPHALLIAVLCLLPGVLLADALDGHYLTTLDGQPAEMHLRSQGQQVNGEYLEGGRLRLQISGSFDGQLLRAQISEAQSGQLIANMNATYANGMLNAHIAARHPTTGTTLERKALFHRQNLDPAVATQSRNASGSTSRDPALIGTWVHEKISNSGGANSAAMTTQMILQLSEDGSVAQLDPQCGRWRRLELRHPWRAAIQRPLAEPQRPAGITDTGPQRLPARRLLSLQRPGPGH